MEDITQRMGVNQEIVEELRANGFEKSKFKILVILTRLRQICCHPSLFIDNYEGDISSRIIVTGTVTIQTEGRILYYSGAVNLKDEFTAQVTEGTAYIVFR